MKEDVKKQQQKKHEIDNKGIVIVTEPTTFTHLNLNGMNGYQTVLPSLI